MRVSSRFGPKSVAVKITNISPVLLRANLRQGMQRAERRYQPGGDHDVAMAGSRTIRMFFINCRRKPRRKTVDDVRWRVFLFQCQNFFVRARVDDAAEANRSDAGNKRCGRPH
jgi:hypothetical protein